MLLNLVEEAKYFLNVNNNMIIEKFSFMLESDIPIFKMGQFYLDFDRFNLELHRIDNEIQNIYLLFTNIEKEVISEVTKFFNVEKDKEHEVFEIDTLVFSINNEALTKYIQPNYNSPDKSSELMKFMDENNSIVLLNFDYYELEGLY